MHKAENSSVRRRWRNIYFGMMGLSLLCMFVTRGDDFCLVIAFVATVIALVLGLTGKRGFWD